MNELRDVLKGWVQQVKTCQEALEGNLYLFGELLYECKERGLWRNLSDNGENFKSFRAFINESSLIKIRKSQVYKIINAFEYAKQHKIDKKRFVEIGVNKLATADKIKENPPSVHTVDKAKRKDLEAQAGHPREFSVYLDNEDYTEVEQAINSIMKVEGIDNKGKALKYICVEYLSGVGWSHAEKKKTTQEIMRDYWEKWWKPLKYPKVKRLVADTNYTRYARTLQKLATIHKAEGEQGFVFTNIVDVLNRIYEYYKAGWGEPDMPKIVSRYPDYRENPDKFKPKPKVKSEAEEIEDIAKKRKAERENGK